MKEKVDKIRKCLTDPAFRMDALIRRGFYNKLSDEVFIKKKFSVLTGVELNLENPRTFNEKINWLKINNRQAVYTRMVDKYEAKKYVSERIGDAHIIPTIGIWKDFDDIYFDDLPDRFVLKCTHDSGSVIVCQNKALFNRKWAKEKLEQSLNRNYYFDSREWPYRNVKRKIIAEKFIGGGAAWQFKFI